MTLTGRTSPEADISSTKGLNMGQEQRRNGQIDETDLERLRKEHQDLDETITRLESQVARSVADATEIRRLKKLKLLKKDAIHQLMRRQASA